jgi:tetratricopeptide (TPR) repeat protein
MEPTPPPAGSGSQAPVEVGSAAHGSGDEIDLGIGSDGSADEPATSPTRPRPRPERGDAASLTKQGIQAFVRGDTRQALGLLKQAQRANPNHAPTWRGLGLVHEKLGERGAAKAAYQRYLIIAPNAPDAAQIRKRMAAL